MPALRWRPAAALWARGGRRSLKQARAPTSRADEAGAGVLTTSWGVLAFLAFLFLAVQIAVNLYTTSTVTALAQESVRRAALAGGSRADVTAAGGWLEARVGPSVDLRSARWRADGDVVRLDVEFVPPGLMLDLTSSLRERVVRRQFESRVERRRSGRP